MTWEVRTFNVDEGNAAHCGLATMSRAVAEARLVALAQGAQLADQRLAGR